VKGKVVGINTRKGFVAVDAANGITVLELLGSYEVEMEDIISGALESLGGETVRNETQNETMEVYIQGVHCTIANANSLMS
jgi:hypothetical protein